MRLPLLAAAALLAMGVASARAAPVTIGFDSLAFPGDSAFSAAPVGPSVSEQGFTLTTDNMFLPSLALIVFGRDNPRNADPGGATLIVNRPLSTVTLTRDDGGNFDFLGFSAALIQFFEPENGGDVQVFFDGMRMDSTTVRLEPGLALQTFDVVRRDISSVSFFSPNINFFQLDDLRLDDRAVAVPAPAALGLFGLGGAALLTLRRRRSAETAAV